PFTLENQTSENFTDFMEKSSTVRFVVPAARDAGAMLFGELPRRSGRWYLGVFNGDGQDLKNLDHRPAIIGRAFFAPLALLPRHADWMEEVWLGGSIWWQRNDNLGGAGPPSTSGATSGDLANVTTQGGLTVFSSNYANGTDALKNAVRARLAPDGTTLKWAVDLNLALPKRLGLRAEYVHQSIDVREYDDVNPGNGNLTRTPGGAGNATGWAAYVEAYAWIGGNVNADKPGLYQIPHWNGYIPPPPPQWALQLAARYEHLELAVGLPPTPGLDPATGQ